MRKIKVAALRAAGCNCDGETVHAYEMCGAGVDLIHINEFIRKERTLSEYQILALPGGFTYGDDISAGKILANELKYLLIEEMKQFVAEGKLIIGICNGFQVLVKAGLLPDVNFNDTNQDVTLTFNDSGKFEDRWVYLKVNQNSRSVFTENMQGVVYFPVAHSEGKFVSKNQDVLERLKLNGQVVFQYSDASGNLVGYPGNPNGSVDSIAGICDSSGRVFGLMPHPERYVHPTHYPHWTREGVLREPQGLQIFQNAVNFAAKNL